MGEPRILDPRPLATALFGRGTLKVKFAGPVRGLSLTPNSRGVSSATALNPHPYQSLSLGERKERKGTFGGTARGKSCAHHHRRWGGCGQADSSRAPQIGQGPSPT